MNGNISVESKEGMGSTFTLEIPIIKDPHPDVGFPKVILHNHGNYGSNHINQGNHVNQGSNHGNTLPLILLVEDNVDLSAYLTGVLHKTFKIITAFNGNEGFEMALENIPDLILSDMMMPEMDGFELCTRIRSQETTSHIPFVLLTARTAIEDRLEGLELGADEYLTKPFNLNELVVRIIICLSKEKPARKVW